MPPERHPFEPFLPHNARLLMLGTFPPAPKRWCMPFYYPNYQNDMWRIFGLYFFHDKTHFLLESEKKFNLPAIKTFLIQRGIALFDTATTVIRTKNTASDKDLKILEATDIDQLLQGLPQCKALVTAGQLATQTVAERYNVGIPPMGDYVTFATQGRTLRLYRMPSSSRAYPMTAENKAKAYAKVFRYALEE